MALIKLPDVLKKVPVSKTTMVCHGKVPALPF
jgi:hypothetical protein